MAKKKKINQSQYGGKILGRVDDKGNKIAFIQNPIDEEDIAPVKQNNNTWFKKGTLDDSGYAIENPIDAINRINAGILMTGVDALGQFGKGFLGSAEGVTDIAKTTTADVLDFFGADNKARKLRESAERTWGVNEQLEQALASDNGTGIDDMSFLGEKGKTVPQGLGTTMFSMTTGGLGGALLGTTAGASATSMALLGMSAAGNSEQEAIKEMKANQKINGLSDKEIYKNAKLYGVLSGIIETGTEMMFGAAAQGSQLLGIGTGAFDEADDAVINALTKKISNKMIKTFTQAGLKATSEGVEEVASGFLNAWAKKLTYMKQEDIKKLIEDENLLDSFLSGTFSAALSQAPSVVNNITTTENGKLRLRNDNEIRDFLTNLNEQEQQVVEREIENRLGQEENVTKKRRSEIEKQVIEDLDRGYINANTIRDVLGENYNAERDVRLNESFNEETRRTQAYENDLSKYDEKQRATIQRAIDSGLLNNSNKTHDFVDLIAKISADKGVDFDFTNNERINESGFGIKGKTVNGYVKDGTINLNLESNQALNKTVGHEITHVLEGTDVYKELQNSLKSYLGEREWNNRIDELAETYKNVENANIENELTSDLVGEYVFNDEKFVKSLSTRNPNLFQKIFDEIKYMVKIATAGSKEARDLEKVKRAFEKAYRETSKTQQGTQYSVEGKEEVSLSYAKQRFNRNMGKYSIGDNLEDAYLEHQLRKEELDSLYEYAKKKAHNDSELRELERRYNELIERDNPNQANEIQYSITEDSNGNEELTLYHGTSLNAAFKIQKYGFVPNSAIGADGGAANYNYFTNSRINAETYRDRKDRYSGQLLRVKKTADMQIDDRIVGHKKGEYDFRTQRNVTPDEIQILTEDGYWTPISNYDLYTDTPADQKVIDKSLLYDDDGNKVSDVKYSLSDNEVDNYIQEKGYTFQKNGNLEVNNLTDKQIKDLVKLYHTTGYEDVSADYLTERLKSGQMPIQREVADRFIEKELGHKPQYDTTQIFEDAEGNPLTKEQVEFYKDSGVRDIRGRLIPVYHRTDADFTIFDDKAGTQHGKKYGKGFYFSITPENYGNNIMKVYLNAKDGEFKYVPKMGYYIVQEANQIKNVDNKAPTSNPDIRYSLSDNGEMVDNSTGEKVTLETSDTGTTGTLMAIHNLGEEKFNGVMDLGGFPYPSIAITKPSTISHEGYGDASAIFSKDAIDPELNNRNKVYSRDAYTPRFPHLEYKMDSNVVKNIRNVIGDYDYRNVQPGDSYISDANNILNDLEDNINNRGLDKTLKDIKDNVAMKYIYLKNTNPSFQVETRNENYSSRYDNETLQKFLDNYDGEYDLNDLPSSEYDKYAETMWEAYREQLENKYKQTDMDDETISKLLDMAKEKFIGSFAERNNFAMAAYKLNKYGAEKQTLDTVATKEKINNTINQEEYEKWVDDLFKNIIEKRGLRNNKEYYTSSGNRRTFEQLHDEYNLENVVKILDALDDTGSEGEMFTGISEIAGNASIRFNSIDDIKANENLLTTVGSEEYSNMLEDISNRLHDIQSAIIERGHNNSDNYFIAMDNLAQAVADTARLYGEGKKVDANRVLKEIKEYGFNPTLEEAQQIYDMFSELRQLPTQYFEAKPKRAVGFDELETMVIPNNWSQETKQRMTDRGIKYVEYDPSVEGDRQRVINQFDDLKFSLSQNNIAPTSGWNVRSEDVRLQSAFKEAIAPLQEQVQELTKTIQNIAPSRAMTEEEANEYATQTQRGFENEAAPIRENLTPEENRRMDVLDLLERNNMLDEEHQYERDQLLEKANPTIPNEEVTPGQALEDIRDMEEVGKRDVKAYQYEHPEVKPYFQEEARGMLSDLQNSQKGERVMWESTEKGQGTNWEVKGIKRFTSPVIAELLDSKYGYTYKDIEKGLNAIIENHGAENIAVAKRIEFVLDDNLRNGYTDWQTGMEIPPNQDYLNMLAEQEWNDYYDDINSQYPLEEVPQYAIEDEETDFSDVKIDKDLQDMTVDDINLEPFLQGLVKADERQAERQQLREELNQKKEVKIPRNPEINKAKNKASSLFVNEFAAVDDFGKKRGNNNIKFKADSYNNYQAIAQSNIETAQTDINGKAIGRSGNSIFQEAEKLGLKDIFDSYLKHWANVDRAKQGKGANYKAQESYKIVKEMEAKNPELKRLGKDMWQYYRNARHNLRDAGVISQQISDLLGRMYPHYTPYISENIENYFVKDGELKPKQTIKRAKGGAILEGLLSTEEAMQIYTKSEFNTIFGNDLYREIVNTSSDTYRLGGDDRGMQFVNADNLYADKNGYYLTAYENGEPITARISEDMYRTLTRESRNRISDIENTFSMVTKPLQAASKLRRNILTSWSPTFIAKNFIKDFQEGLFNSKYTKDFIKNYPSAFKELATNTELAQQFKSLYGSGLTMGQYDIDANNYNPSGKNRNFLKGIKNANELIELAPRFAEFKASIEHGASLQEAMYNAREVTTNFSRGGTLAKALNRNGFTFLNSSIQGFDKFIRNFSGENGAKGIVNSLAKAAIFGIAPAVFNELAFGSGDDKDEEYEAIPDYIKDNYYIIKTGDGNFIRIPKGRVLSVFGSAARRTIEAMEGEENAFEGYFNNVQQQIGINNPEENNIFAPLIQAIGGRKLDSGQTAGSAWYGGDIIPSRLQKERPEDQYDASIDKFSIWLGQKTGISPYKINYVLDQYTGGIGDLAIPMMTEEANSDGSIIAPIKDQFTADTVTDNKYVSEFYDTYNKIYSGSKKTDEDILKKNYMSNISFQMSDLYKERREIQADTTLSKKEKYEKAQAIKAEINRLAKEGLDNYEKISITGDYADINGQEYQKTDDGWKKLNSNTSDEVNSLGLTNREKNNYIKTQKDISSIKKKYKDTDDYVGKKQDIIGEIINTNLTDDAKMSLYQDTYKDKFSNYATDLGFDADTYLEYKAQDFSADKDKNGKSISGSKKRKVFDYVNSLDIPYEQKLILAKSEYNSFNDNNYEIIEYIENTGMDYDERIELYKALGFKVDGDSISW